MNNDNTKITFTGAGCNYSSIFAGITHVANSPSKRMLPAGATWPFVKLSIDKQGAEFTMAQIRKLATPSDTSVSLSKLGYIYFQTHDHANDFGFASLKVRTITVELRKRGYHLGESCSRNILIARVSLVLTVAIPLVILIVIIVMTLLRPSG